MVAEVAQFAILVGIAWVVALGFGNRKGFVSNMLAERKRRVDEHVAEAAVSDERLAAAKKAAEDRTRGAEEECRTVLEAARADAESSERETCDAADAEAQRIAERAETALANERMQMQARAA